MRKNKKGISAIVATVLIILITVAAVTIFWMAIIPMIRDNVESSTVCFDAISQVQIKDAGYTCYDSASGNISLQLKMGPKDVELSDVQILASSGGTTSSYNLSGQNLPGANEERVYQIDVSSLGAAPDSVQIAPIIKVGNTDKTCDVAGTIDLKAC